MLYFINEGWKVHVFKQEGEGTVISTSLKGGGYILLLNFLKFYMEPLGLES